MSDLLSRLYRFLAHWFAPEPSPLPDPEPAPAPPPSPAPVPPSPESSVLVAINRIRTSSGLPKVVEDESLDRLASTWAASMASSIGLSHGDFAGRITQVYPNNAASENIAEGQPDATGVVASWMESPPHRANILGEYNRLGVGTGRDEAGSIYWCVDFVQID